MSGSKKRFVCPTFILLPIPAVFQILALECMDTGALSCIRARQTRTQMDTLACYHDALASKKNPEQVKVRNKNPQPG